ncbi:MAG: Crotonyl-CoA reductase [Verrucomicrobia subdivision 3 bacterium]|nr:Crotonyl-CoA reductase [Limisphaerales bacterium]MCS1414527.1 Crotonyl-CoA reductase [Limisphaerales bacterium]
MRALSLRAIKSDALLEEVEQPVAGVDEVVVKLQAASLNRRDYWITQGLYPGIVTPLILGSDGSGSVHAVGENVSDWAPGDEVVIYPSAQWGENEAVQDSEFTVLGMPENGTFAEFVKVRSSQLFRKPAYLDWVETAAIPVAGLTAYRALVVQGQLKPGRRVLITGIGGGVAVFALQFTLATGSEAIVTSSSTEKIERALNLGAKAGLQYTEANWGKRLLKEHGPCDLIIDGAGGPGYGDLVNLLKPGGRLISYGSTAGRSEKLDLFKIFWRQLHLIGSTLGSPADFEALLGFMEKHQIKPVIDQQVPLAEGPKAIADMRDAAQFGKVTLEI